MKKVNFQMGDIYVDGVDGFFSQTNKTGGWCHIYHRILNDDGVGCKKNVFVGSVSRGVFADQSQGIEPRGNSQFGEQVEEVISKFIENGCK